jgi:hypothetical protein
MITEKQKFRKIPVLITKWNDEDVKGWRAELPDNWESWKPNTYDKINFEDIGHHFNHGYYTHERDNHVFYTRQCATAAAKYIIKEYLKGFGKIWF